MSALEDRLRDAFRADADTVRPESIPDPPARPARRGLRRARSRLGRLLIPLTAAAAVGAVVAGFSLASPLLRGHQHPAQRATAPSPSASPEVTGPVPLPIMGPAASHGVPTSAPSPGVPRFYVTVWIVASAGTDSLVVRDTATGKVTGRINPPGRAIFASIAATAGDRTFITAIIPATGCTSELYQFQLNARGQPGPLVPLHITVPGVVAQSGNALAITPDGRTIAYQARLCARVPHQTGFIALTLGEVGVIDLATRHVRVWGTSHELTDITDLSLSDDGGLLSYSTISGTRVLRTSAPGGSLVARSRVVSRSVIWSAIAGDGTSLYGCSVSPYRSGGWPIPARGTLIYSAISLASGRQQVIASWPGTALPQCFASLDPAGGHLLVEFPGASGAAESLRPAVLDLRSGRLTDIKAPAFFGPLDVAW